MTVLPAEWQRNGNFSLVSIQSSSGTHLASNSVSGGGGGGFSQGQGEVGGRVTTQCISVKVKYA